MPVDALSVAQLHVGYDGTDVVRDVSFAIGVGERLVIAGPSGSGKSSLLRAIAGLTGISAGQVSIAGVDVTRSAPERRGAVYLHQVPVLFPHLDVFENVAFPMRLRGVPSADVSRSVSALLDRVQLGGFARRAPSTLSGGQQHRVALARALAADPHVLLLDEPFSSLDPSLRREVREDVLRLLDADSPAALIVTHDIDEAVSIGGRLGILLGGQLQQCEPADRVLARPQTAEVARMLGIANIIPGMADRLGAFECVLGRFPGWGAPGAGVLVARPMALRVVHETSVRSDTVTRGVVVRSLPQVVGDLVVVRVGDVDVTATADRGVMLEPGSAVCVDVDVHRVQCLPLTSGAAAHV